MLKLFDLSLRLNGFPLGKAKTELEKTMKLSEKGYAFFLESKKHEIFDFHLNNNPYYKNLIGDKKIERWEDIPVMKKIHFQQPLPQRLSKGYNKRNVYINKTSGSSGDPFVFAKDKFCHALIWANIMRRFKWYSIDFNHSLQARFYGMPLDFIANKKLRIKDFLSRRYRFNIFDFSDQAMGRMLQKFQNTKFDYINGYTNSIVLLAKFLKKKQLFLSDICPSLKVCIVTSEMLFDEDKQLLRERFNIPIINEYGSAELDIIALESPDGVWRVNSETLFVEILDDNDQVLPYGHEGRIVVTSLYNKAHPMIRYEVGDIGILDEKSTLQHPILKQLIGRTNDVAVLPSGKKSPGMTFYSITKKLFDDQGNVKEFVILQTQTDTFQIDYVSDKELSETEIQQIKKVLDQFLESGLKYHFNRKTAIDRGKSGKLKQFRSLVPAS
ncbi:phenylacetate--CoA ligase family protein [Flavobacterium sp. CYK-4]|uniref:phenylacetate--CoA ligase family protein n=1 Tax=Flavobacterium lotistagni TaxID=2709660 RepID=UPI00140CD1FF|nr:phenylacetate--CoA ligase family protein [Flavobacterium lotistagni]NHM07790.1 phenylacetate--CoA ligase family protein [Flavobacterium lotistagni]